MDNPKISVLVPMYNRKHYIAQCLDSALNQTFREDYEIIVRDDGSTDGSAGFVEQRYAAAIASGKLKLRRNEKNVGETKTNDRLFSEATGKYFMILHSDDIYLPNALEHMYSVAEHFHADFVHGCRFFRSPPGGIIESGTTLQMVCRESNPVNQVTRMSDEPVARFKEFFLNGTFVDLPYNFYNRSFILNEDLFPYMKSFYLFLLLCLMKAKVFVKTPVPFYVYRNAPDSKTNNHSWFLLEDFINGKMKTLNTLNEILPTIEFFRDNETFQILAKLRFLTRSHQYQVKQRNIYGKGITPEIHHAVEKAFKKHFGDNALYAALLFHWIHIIPTNQNIEELLFANLQISPPPHSINRIDLLLEAA